MDFHKNLAYEASAGSGKTFALVIRYISLLYLGAKPNTIAMTQPRTPNTKVLAAVITVVCLISCKSFCGQRSMPSRNSRKMIPIWERSPIRFASLMSPIPIGPTRMPRIMQILSRDCLAKSPTVARIAEPVKIRNTVKRIESSNIMFQGFLSEFMDKSVV